MISKTELANIKERLEMSQNPLFFFDNDVDGLCSFLILRRAIGRGRGVAIKSFPELKELYIRKVDELNPDAVFILDKAEVDPKFIDAVEQKGVPIIWIDHHESKTPKDAIRKTDYYNSIPTAEPVTYIAQNVFNRQEDLWLAIIGCIGDVYLPDFAKKFSEQNPELLPTGINAFEALHSSEIGKIVRMLNFGLMDSITNVVTLIKYLFNAKGPHDIFEENKWTEKFHKRYSQLNEFYSKQIKKAEDGFDGGSRVLFFSYSGAMSMSSDISNTLYYNHRDKLIVVAFKRPDKVNVSIRGKNALDITKKLIKDISGATGGGHQEATGAMIPIDEFEKFKDGVKKLNF